MNNVTQFLSDHNIDFTLHEHPPVYTCEEADEYCGGIPGMSCKNLFLQDNDAKNFFLLVLPAHKKADLKKFAQRVEKKKITFGSAEAMKKILNLEPGSVSPFGLINDINKAMKVYIDREVYDADIVSFHPNINTATLEISRDMFHKYLNSSAHHVQIIES